MSIRQNEFKLTPRDIDILNILWSNKEPFIASDIAKKGNGLSINTVQAVLRDLLNKELIEVADIVYSGTVLTRSYRPLITEQDLIMKELKNQFKNIDKKAISIPSIVTFLIENEKNEELIIEELEKLLAERKKSLYEKEK